ncbi:DNA helicase UvrD [Pasteurella sp. PK-2025]|uniref:DNA helicase UvrD n=1 Tax=Pasteurella sp. PK-2025 TaxID=3413133 RepID=UPI003C76FD13
MKGKYWLNIAIAFDQLFNTFLSGSPDETLSSRAYRGAILAKKPKKKWLWSYKAINKIFFWQKDHCKQAYESEVKRRQYPSAFSNL